MSVPEGRYVLQNVKTGKVFDLADWKTTEGNPIICWVDNGGANQKVSRSQSICKPARRMSHESLHLTQWDLKRQDTGGYVFISAYESSTYAGYQEDEEADPVVASKTPRDWLFAGVEGQPEHF